MTKLPANWPRTFKYTRRSFSEDLHPNLLAHMLSTGAAEDLDMIHPLLEEERVHGGLEIRTITEANHVLAKSSRVERGLFAREEIPSGVDLGTYVGKMRLINPDWKMDPDSYDYALVMQLGAFRFVIDGAKYANELAMMNDYRGIAEGPNVDSYTVIHRGAFFPMFRTRLSISKGSELLWDYGTEYWMAKESHHNKA